MIWMAPASDQVTMDHLPACPGSYALLLRLALPATIMVGRLGGFHFPASDYLYLGSARGSGGLRARLRHHFRISIRPHWHLDYLRAHAEIIAGWGWVGPENLECRWSRAVCRLPGAAIICPGFGAADCRSGCSAHLVAFSGGGVINQIENALQSALPEGHHLLPIA